MKWFSRRVVPNYGITYGDSNLDVDYTEYDDLQQSAQDVDYFRVGFKYHPRWDEVYNKEFDHACQRFYNSRGYWPQQTYNYVLSAVESEANSNAEAVIARLINNGY